jgi:hypothetical protein
MRPAISTTAQFLRKLRRNQTVTGSIGCSDIGAADRFLHKLCGTDSLKISGMGGSIAA